MTRLVRAVHFHATPPRRAARLAAQLAALAERFAPVDEGALLRLVDTGRWDAARPGVIVTFFNGLRDNAEVAAPILDRVGLTGWFFVPSGFVAAPPARQRAFAAARGIRLPAGAADPVAMAPAQVARLAERHVIASHTRSHRPLAGMTAADARAELAGSRHDLEAITGRPVRSFAGLHGGGRGADPVIDAALRAAGYELLFANHAIQRLGGPALSPAGCAGAATAPCRGPRASGPPRSAPPARP